MKQLQKKGSLYHWVIVFACLLLSAASVGMLSYFNALFLSPVAQSLQVKRSALVLYSTCSTATTMLIIPFVGRLYRRFPMRPLILLGAVLGAGAHLCYSMSRSVYGFYAGGVLAGLAACLFGSVPITLLLSNWFADKRGLVTGLAFTGSGLASSLLSPTVSRLIQSVGWRGTYRLIAAAILLTALLALVLLRPTPQSVGLLPYGAAAPSRREEATEATGFTQAQTLRLPSYWLFALAIFFLGFATMGTQQHLVAYWQAAGVEQALAVKMYALVLMAGVCGKVLVGILYDHFSAALASILCCGVAIAAFLSLLLCTSSPGILIPALLFGLTTSLQVILPAYLTQKFFGTRDFVSNVGLLTTILYLGVAVGAPVSALIYDSTGFYRPAWVLHALLAAAALAAILLADRLSMGAFRRILNCGRGK